MKAHDATRQATRYVLSILEHHNPIAVSVATGQYTSDSISFQSTLIENVRATFLATFGNFLPVHIQVSHFTFLLIDREIPYYVEGRLGRTAQYSLTQCSLFTFRGESATVLDTMSRMGDAFSAPPFCTTMATI